MAKGQKRSGREVKKPKKKLVKTVAPSSVFDDGHQAAKKKPPTAAGPAGH
jgi:hypothetical protein